MAPRIKQFLASSAAKKIYLGAVILAVLFFAFNDLLLPWYVNSGGILKVPSVIGRRFEDAQRMLDSIGLEARMGEIRPDRTHPEGVVVDQNPSAGHEVKRGRRIYLGVSGGEQLVEVPNVRGRSLRDARFALEREGLRLGAAQYEHSEEYPENTIVEQAIIPGARVKRDTYVSVVISKGSGSQDVTVPDLTGKTLGEAEALLTQANLKLGNISYMPSSDLLPNTIVEQFPRGGDTVSKGQPVDLFVVQGGEPTRQEILEN